MLVGMTIPGWSCKLLWLAAALLAGGSMAYAQAPDYAKLRAERAASLTAPYGWFSLVALTPLPPGETAVGSSPENRVVLQHVPARLLALQVKGAAVTLSQVSPGVTLGGALAHVGQPVPTSEDDAAALGLRGVKLWVIVRNGQLFLRVKDPKAPARQRFHGLRWYAPDAALRVQARWVPYTVPHTLPMLNKVGQKSQVPVPGYAEFSLDGHRETLTPIPDGDDLLFVFLDKTSHTDTDGGGRFLEVPLPANGVGKPGSLVLDFNLAHNPPCAYSPYATCPLAPKENRLRLRVAAGEKLYQP